MFVSKTTLYGYIREGVFVRSEAMRLCMRLGGFYLA